MHSLWVILWIVVGLIGVACLAAGARMEYLQRNAESPPPDQGEGLSGAR